VLLGAVELLGLCGAGALIEGVSDEALPAGLEGAWALRILPLTSVGELDEENELDESVLLEGRVPGIFGMAGAGVPRMVVPREPFALALEDPGVGFAAVPRMVVFCAGGVAGCVLCGAGFGGTIIPGTVGMLGAEVVEGLRAGPGGTVELEEEGEFPAGGWACAAAALARASARAIAR